VSTLANAYDGSGLRIEKVTGGSTTVYIFSGTKVIAESPPFDDVCVRQRC